MRPPRGGGFRGGRDGGFRGGRGGRGGSGRGGRGFGGGGYRDEGPPSEVVEVSSFLHASEGKVDEIFGPINESHFSIKMMEGIVATSYAPGDKFYIDPNKLLPLARFLSQPKGQTQAAGRGGRGGGRGGRGGFGGRGGGFGGRGRGRGRGPPRGGGGRGGFRGRGRG
ncbi:hypothetical protein OIU76_023919 [Salix suchowensis]|nr:hypothetical protein OIU76_023919 [Salix suchowensis]